MTKIAVFVGSLRKQSINKALARALEKAAPEGMEFEYIDINLPLYSEDIESAGMPVQIQVIKDTVEQADGVLIITPEYNRGIPGVLKNSLDWVSRPYGANSFAKKPVGVLGASMTPVGTALAQSDVRRFLAFSNAKTLGQPEVYVANGYEVFDENGEILSERWQKNFQQFMDAFAAWVADEK